jgi:RimJ/RimL family protein N-acetyltransferase
MLKGERVILRAIERDDLEAMWAWNNNLQTEVLGGGDPPMPQSLASVQAGFEAEAAKGERNTQFAIELDARLIGVVALHRFDATARVCELGIVIGDPNSRGKGYGRDALRTVLAYAFRYLNLHKVYLRVNGTNERAIRAYQAAGFTEEGRLRQHVWNDGQHIDLVYMGVLRDEWQH